MTWIRSSRSGDNGCCVEVGFTDAVLVRDSKDPDGPVLAIPPAAWRRFVADIKEAA